MSSTDPNKGRIPTVLPTDKSDCGTMVVLSPGDAVLLTLLLVCVPLQMWLQHHYSLSSTEARDGQVFAVIREVHKGLQKYLSPHYWSTMALYTFSSKHVQDPDIAEYARLSWEQLSEEPLIDGECPAVEVLRRDHPLGYFAASTQQRRYRTSLVQYRVGQVVRHTEYGFRGVIVGWDETCQAPRSFIEQSYSPEDTTELCAQANYAVLVDTHDYPLAMTQYFAQRHLTLVRSTKVEHPQMDIYFDQFDGSRYLSSGWLAAMYPED